MRQIICLATFFTCIFASNILVNHESGIDPIMFENLINDTIEGLRPQIPDPLEIAEAAFTLPATDDAPLQGNGSISNFKLQGLQGFQVSALNFNIFSMTLNFTIIVPAIEFYTDYDVHLLVANTIPIFGSGNITIHVDRLEVVATAKANLDGGIQVSNVRLQLGLGNNTLFDIHGLFNDEDVSLLVSSILNDLTVKLIDEQQELISDLISPVVEAIINAILAGSGETTIAPLIDATAGLN